MKDQARVRKVLPGAAVIAALLVAIGAGWWAGSTAMGDQELASAEETGVEETWATATHESVGRSMNLSTTVQQPFELIATNRFPGIVREVNEGSLENGDTAYRVGEHAVRVIEAESPFWRDMAEGTSGSDVAAIQSWLESAGYLSEGQGSGDFSEETSAPVRAWQNDLGIDETGTVQLGEVVAVSQTPVVIQLGDEISLGAELGGGGPSVQAPTGERSFSLALSEGQGTQVPVEANVEVQFEDFTWEAVVSSVEEGGPESGGGPRYELVAPDGGEVCGHDCDQLPTDAQLSLSSSVEIRPPVEGTATR